MSEGWLRGEEHQPDGVRLAPDVPAGSRRTEIGMIPEDWDKRHLRTDISLLSGHHVMARDCNSRGVGVPYLTGPADFPEGQIRHTRFTSRPTTICRAGDILVTVKGSGAGTLVEADAEYCISRQLMAIRPTTWNPRFLRYSLLQNASRIKAASTGLIPGLSRSDILDQPIPIPSRTEEQHAIADVLSDVDELIGSLEALIAKKRAIKQAAMQQLLTGRTRLPGLRGEWENKRLGSMLSVHHGRDHQGFIAKHGRYPLLGSGGIIGRTNRSIFAKPSVLIGRKGTITKPQFMSEPFWAVDTLFYTDVRPRASAKFLYYLFCQIDWLAYNEASGLPSLNSRTIEHIVVSVPPLPEQHAIAAVLSDMDAEIAALERRLDKTRAIKQGMMQQLLTGSIRLPISDAEAEDDRAHDA